MINATVTGNLGRPAELRDAGGTVVCSFSVASNTKIKGEKVTTWVRCSLWGKRGESLVQYLTQGTKVAVAGELSTREHDGKTYLELRVSELDLLGGGDRQRTPQAQPQTIAAGTTYTDDYSEQPDDDIPF